MTRRPSGNGWRAVEPGGRPVLLINPRFGRGRAAQTSPVGRRAAKAGLSVRRLEELERDCHDRRRASPRSATSAESKPAQVEPGGIFVAVLPQDGDGCRRNGVAEALIRDETLEQSQAHAAAGLAPLTEDAAGPVEAVMPRAW